MTDARRDPVATSAAIALPLFLATLPGSIAPMGIAAGLLGAVTLARLWRGPAPRWQRTPLDLAALVWFGALVVASAFALDPAESWPRVTKGLMPLLAGAVAVTARDPRVGRRAVVVYLAVATLAALVGTVEWVQHGAGYAWRARGPSHHHMTYGGQLLLEFPVALAIALTARGARARLAAGAVALVLAVALATTFTRSAWAGAFVASLLVLAATYPWGVAACAVAGAAAFAFAPGEWGDRIRSMVQPRQGYNGERLLMWEAGWRMFRSDWLTGVGLLDMHGIYPRFRSPAATEEVGHLHNAYVQVAATMGAVGLAAFAFLVSALLRTAGRGLAWGRGLPARLRGAGLAAGLRLGVTAAIVGMLVAGLFEWNFGDEELLYHLYALAGLAWAAAGWGSERPEGER
ncbi:MAG: O-antigen ligase family protein [bacterium]